MTARVTRRFRVNDRVHVRTSRGWLSGVVIGLDESAKVVYRVKMTGSTEIMNINQDTQWVIRKEIPQAARSPFERKKKKSGGMGIWICIVVAFLVLFVFSFLIRAIWAPHHALHGKTLPGFTSPMDMSASLGTQPARHPEWIKRSKLLDDPPPEVSAQQAYGNYLNGWPPAPPPAPPAAPLTGGVPPPPVSNGAYLPSLQLRL